ncbi:MAG: YmdB family metallophosphoesterase [Planctomycetota bacterium]|nr:MAG: YmdB family metallophosphoesterase [Planctomycetota bacterium]
MRIVMLGDVVGKPGVRIACRAAAWLRREIGAAVIIANAENAADGSGLRCDQYRKLIDAGIDGITLGDHVYRRREIIDVLERESNIIRPANLPAEAPGRTHMTLPTEGGHLLLVTAALGRVFMKPVDCPFRAVERIVGDPALGAGLRLVDFHAEATSDMQLMGRFLDGRVTGVLGTHTHVATADSQILPGGTGFQCDVGMTGPFESILGRKVDPVLKAALTGLPVPFQVSTGDVRMNATWLDADPTTGRCLAIGRIDVAEAEIPD